MHLIKALSALLMILALSPLLAQEPESGSGSSGDAETESSADAAPPPTPGALDEYEASEQISEDLSVAFPVDI